MTDNKQAQMKRKHTKRNSYNNISKSAKKQHFDYRANSGSLHDPLALHSFVSRTNRS